MSLEEVGALLDVNAKSKKRTIQEKVCIKFLIHKTKVKLSLNEAALMRNGAIFRIAMWASAGFLVSVCWGFYFASTDKTNPIQSIVYTLADLSQPVAWAVTVLYPDFPLGLRTVVAANVATYALLGVIVETIRQHYRPLQISN